MPIGVLFWVIYVIAVLFYGWGNWPFDRRSGSGLVFLLLLFLLGWRAFGFVVTN